MTRTTQRRHHERHVLLIALFLVGLVTSASGCNNRDLAIGGQSLVNSDRSAHALAPLAWDQNAADKAQAWADTMARQRRIFHSTLTDGISGGWTILAENVGYSQSVGAVESLFMQSASHRASILNPRFVAVGIGVAEAGGSTYVVQVFRG